MRAIVVDRPGGTERLTLSRVPDPTPGPGEVLLEVAAAGVNRADLLQREGRYPPPKGAGNILGLEAAGTVAAVGANVTDWRPGQRAMALLAGGGYAERVAVPAGQLMTIPDRITTVDAAAIPEAFLTAWLALDDLARAKPGDRVLIHAGASGVGSAAIGIARERGCSVLASSRRAERLVHATELGARPIVVADGRFAEQVREATDGHGADVIVDLVGPAYWRENLAGLAEYGRIVMLSLTTGARAEANFAPLLARQATVVGATLRARSPSRKAALVRAFGTWALERFADGRLAPTIDRRLPLADAERAHRLLASNRVVGKLLLTVEHQPATG